MGNKQTIQKVNFEDIQVELSDLVARESIQQDTEPRIQGSNNGSNFVIDSELFERVQIIGIPFELQAA